jgi:predicted DsbA family dithiol-disulfide isomerase
VEDLDNPEFADEVRIEERKLSTTIRGVPQISFGGQLLANGAQHEELLAAAILKIQDSTGQCADGGCVV